MRRRLVWLTLVVAVVAVTMLAVPLGMAGVLLERRNAQRSLDNAAFGVGRQVEDRLGRGEAVNVDLLARMPPEYEVRLVADGQTLATGRQLTGPTLQAHYTGSRVEVEMRQATSDAYSSVDRVVLLVALVALVAVAAAVGLGLHQARRLSAPLVELARSAERLGSGDSRQQFRRHGLEEIDRVVEVLERSSARVAAMLAAERQFASDASHQLRTPLTALSMRLEEILNTEDPETVREEARISLGQVERLSAVVDHLLATARQTRSASARPLPVDDVVRQQIEEWRPAYTAAGRKVQVAGTPGLRGCATSGGLGQVLATLLENSLAHGAGTTTVRTRATRRSVVIEVSDEGPGVPEELRAHVFERAVSGHSGTGLGLSLARDLAEADGGRLELVNPRPAVFALFLSAEPLPA